jgi:arylformamidase
MKIHGITLNVEPGMLYWRDGKPPEVISVFKLAEGAASEVSRWLIGAHTGTHIDAPRHFIATGLAVEQLPLEIFVGPARVVDLSAQGDAPITAASVRRANLNGALRPSVARPASWLGNGRCTATATDCFLRPRPSRYASATTQTSYCAKTW